MGIIGAAIYNLIRFLTQTSNQLSLLLCLRSLSAFLNWVFVRKSVLMEPHHHHHHKKQASNSSLTADLFGAPDSPQDPSKGIFASIFPPPSKVLGRNSASSELLGSWQKHAPGNQASPTNKHGSSTMGGESGRSLYRDRGSALQEQRAEPCHLSSSIYYGGRDVYSRSPNSHVAPHYPPVKKDSGEDDLNGIDASRGNWWQGSLYY